MQNADDSTHIILLVLLNYKIKETLPKSEKYYCKYETL